jgi:hypothetical protein
LKETYTIRDVIKDRYLERINQEIPFKHEEKDYIGGYQRAVTKVEQDIKDENGDDLKEVEAIVQSWNKLGAPANVQAK